MGFGDDYGYDDYNEVGAEQVDNTSASSSAGTNNNENSGGDNSNVFSSVNNPAPSVELQGGSAGDFSDSFYSFTEEKSDFSTMDNIEKQLTDIGVAQEAGKMAVLNAEGETRGLYSTGRLSDADTSWLASSVGRNTLANDIKPEPDTQKGFVASLNRGANVIGNKIAERLGTSNTRDTAYDLRGDEAWFGNIDEDYPVSDFVGNAIGYLTPGGARVDRYSAAQIPNATSLASPSQRGTRERVNFGEATLLSGAISSRYGVSPEEEEALFAQTSLDQIKEAEGNDRFRTPPSPQPGATTTTNSSGLLAGLMGGTSSPLYSTFSPYGADAVDSFKTFLGENSLNPFSSESPFSIENPFSFAEGGPVPGAPPNVQQPQAPPAGPVGPVGFVGGTPEQIPDAETVADDVPIDVEEGTFVINAAAAEFMGSDDVKKMIIGAIRELQLQGMSSAKGITTGELDTEVSLLVSKGEVLIPPVVAEVIGYDRLEKINNRGLRETQKRVEENGQSPEAEALDQQPQNPAEGMMAPMAKGGASVSAKGGLDISRGNTEEKSQANISAEYAGKGFAVRPGISYNKQSNSRQYPDGAVVNAENQNIGVALDGKLLLNDDTSLLLGIEKQAGKNSGTVTSPQGEKIPFGNSSTMTRFNMGAIFGDLGVKLSKTQNSNGNDRVDGTFTYQIDKNGKVSLSGNNEGDINVGLEYRF